MSDVNWINENMALAPLHGLIGLTCVEIGEGRAVTRLPDGDHVRSGHAALHGGVVALLADVTSALTMEGTYDRTESIPVSIDLNVRFYGQPKEWPVTAEASIVHKGKRTIGTECVVSDATGRQLARTNATYMLVEGFGNLDVYQGKTD